MQHTLRYAQPNDLSSIVAIYNSTIASRQVTADLQPIAPEQRQTWLQNHLNDPQRPVYVMENAQKQVIAWASFSDYYPRAAYRITAEISIYIAPHLRGQGLGQTLLTHMISVAPQLGIRNIVGIIFEHNQASLKLFLRNGFAQWGKLPQACDLDGKMADVLIIGKQLPIAT